MAVLQVGRGRSNILDNYLCCGGVPRYSLLLSMKRAGRRDINFPSHSSLPPSLPPLSTHENCFLPLPSFLSSSSSCSPNFHYMPPFSPRALLVIYHFFSLPPLGRGRGTAIPFTTMEPFSPSFPLPTLCNKEAKKAVDREREKGRKGGWGRRRTPLSPPPPLSRSQC